MDAKDKAKELILREEIRDCRKTLMDTLKWGVTVLAALETSLYYVRRDAAQHLMKMGVLTDLEMFPLSRWIIGTIFLTMVAFTFSFLSNYSRFKLVNYRQQLIGMSTYSGIDEIPAGTRLVHIDKYLFFVFPLCDLLTWLYFKVGDIIVKIPW